jgi:hypothetical protein
MHRPIELAIRKGEGRHYRPFRSPLSCQINDLRRQTRSNLPKTAASCGSRAILHRRQLKRIANRDDRDSEAQKIGAKRLAHHAAFIDDDHVGLMIFKRSLVRADPARGDGADMIPQNPLRAVLDHAADLVELIFDFRIRTCLPAL